MLQPTENYQGPFFMELATDIVIRDGQLIKALNAITKRIINDLDKPAVTTWEFYNLSTALKGVLLLQEAKYPFRLLGDGEILFMETLP